MRVFRSWQHDRVTEELGDMVVEGLEHMEQQGELRVHANSDNGGSIEVSFETRRFRLVLEEQV